MYSISNVNLMDMYYQIHFFARLIRPQKRCNARHQVLQFEMRCNPRLGQRHGPHFLAFPILPHPLPNPLPNAHTLPPLLLPLLRLLTLPDQTLLVDLRLSRPDVRIDRGDIPRLMPHLPRHEQHNKISHAKITRNKTFRIPGRERVEPQRHDDADTNKNSPVPCVGCQRGLVRQEVEGKFLGHDGVVPMDYDDVGGGLVDDEAGACEANEPVKDFDGVVGGYEEGDAGDEGDGEDWVGAGVSIGLTISQIVTDSTLSASGTDRTYQQRTGCPSSNT
jgi:hypothetical protein